MKKLHQIIAIEKGHKTQTLADITEVYKTFQKPGLFNGFTKMYSPVDEDGLQLPPEQQRVQYHAEALLSSVAEKMSDLINTSATKDWANTQAKADVVVDGKTLLEGVPATFLLYLEKQLDNIKAEISKLPELDPSYDWSRDENIGVWKATPVKSHRTQKVHRPIVKYDATEHHPAQTELITEDQIVGYWTTTRLSGAIQTPRKELLKKRVRKLIDAVKQARAQANEQPVEQKEVAKAVFDYLLGE